VGDRRTSGGPDLYQVLGVTPDADADELRRAYRRRLRQVHPDTREAVDDGMADPAAEARFQRDLRRVLYAYQVLRNPARRAGYDAERIARSARRPDRPPRGAGSRTTAGGTRRPVRSRRSRPADSDRSDSGIVIEIGPLRIDLGLGR